MNPSIKLQITPRVVSRLRSTLGGLSLSDPVFAVAQHRRGGSTEVHLGVGVYARTALPDDATIVEVDGLKFYVDPSMESLFKDGTLDVINDEFMMVQTP